MKFINIFYAHTCRNYSSDKRNEKYANKNLNHFERFFFFLIRRTTVLLGLAETKNHCGIAWFLQTISTAH